MSNLFVNGVPVDPEDTEALEAALLVPDDMPRDPEPKKAPRPGHVWNPIVVTEDGDLKVAWEETEVQALPVSEPVPDVVELLRRIEALEANTEAIATKAKVPLITAAPAATTER